MTKYSDSKVLKIYNFVKRGGTLVEAADKYGCSVTQAWRIACGENRRDVTKHSRFKPSAAKSRRGRKSCGLSKAHLSPKVDCLGLSAPRDFVDWIARRMIEDPPFVKEWIYWWQARGREVIARDEDSLATMMNVTTWDYVRHIGEEVAKRRRNMDTFFKTKRVDLSQGQVLEWRVRHEPPEADHQGVLERPTALAGEVPPGDG